MHLTLFAVVILASPIPQTPAPAESSRAPPVEASAHHPNRIAVKLSLRAKGSGPTNAAMRLSQLLVALRDSLRPSASDELPPGIALDRFAPQVGGDGKSYEASVTMDLSPASFPRLVQLLAVLAAGGSVEVTDLRLGSADPVVALADDMVRQAVDSGLVTATRPGTGSKLATLALFLLAIRREVRQ